MPVAKLDPEKCRRRNFATALKGRHAAPVRFLLSPPAPGPVSARGTLPADEAGALDRINAILGREGDAGLKPEDVYLLYPEVGNTNFVDDRFMFLGRSTLRNVAAMAAAGFAFMNSHRTGDMSTPSELPFGRTFAGRFETGRDDAGAISARTVVGAYMLRGRAPNGANGPTTDDLYAGIAGGTIFDVSLGLYGGDPVCDVCGESLLAYDPETGRDLCPHLPGTHYEMTADEMAGQEGRGVPGGVCSYTLTDAKPAEFSAVFDGAVPGAGFRKAVSLARSGRLAGGALSEARHAYRSLLIPGDRRAGRLSIPKGVNMASLLDYFRKIKISPDDAADLGLDDLDDVPPRRPEPRPAPEPAPDISADLAKLRDENAKLTKAIEDERLARAERDRKDALAKQQADTARIAAAAKSFALGLVNDKKLLPAGSSALETIHAFAHLSAAGLPTDGLDLAAAVARLPDGLVAHSLSGEVVADGVAPAGGVKLDKQDGTMTEERRTELLRSHPLGDATLARLNGKP